MTSRRFRLGLDEVHLARRRDVVHVSDDDRARALARRILEEMAENDLARLAGTPALPERPADPGDDPFDEILFDYEVRWVDELGEPLAGVALAMDVGAGRYVCTTDADGVARIQAPQVKAAKVEVTDLPALRELLRPRWEQVRAGDWLAARVDHTYVECADPLKPVAVKPEIRETIVVQPWVVRARVFELLFDTNKTFLLPAALEHVREMFTTSITPPSTMRWSSAYSPSARATHTRIGWV